jgi:hypothetical protein
VSESAKVGGYTPAQPWDRHERVVRTHNSRPVTATPWRTPRIGIALVSDYLAADSVKPSRSDWLT